MFQRFRFFSSVLHKLHYFDTFPHVIPNVSDGIKNGVIRATTPSIRYHRHRHLDQIYTHDNTITRWLFQKFSFLFKYLFMTTLAVPMKFSLLVESVSFRFIPFFYYWNFIFYLALFFSLSSHPTVPSAAHSTLNICYQNIFDNKSCQRKYNSSRKVVFHWISDRAQLHDNSI